MELSKGGSRIEGWELNNTARLHESHSQTKAYIKKVKAHLKYIYSLFMTVFIYHRILLRPVIM